MQFKQGLGIGAAAVVIVACRRPSASPSAGSTLTDRTVFTDSVLHAAKCAPLRPGDDWRKVCMPRDQGTLPKPLPPDQR